MYRHSKPKILVVGSTGTVGSAVVDAAAAGGNYEVHAVARRAGDPQENVVAHELDLRSCRVSKALASIEFAHIVDCAQPRYTEADDQEFGIDHIKDLEALCTAATKSLIYTSGVWVYGNQSRNSRISEGSLLNPLAYARSRVPVLEYLVGRSRKPWVQLCLPSIVYGNRGPLQDIARDILAGKGEVIDDDSIEWSVVERTDLGQAYLSIIENSPGGKLLCIAEEDSVPVVEFYDKVAGHLGRSVSKISHREMKGKRTSESFEVLAASQSVDASLIRRTTGWKCKYRFRDDFGKFLTSI